MSETTPCYIYRSKKKLEMYLFLAREDDFDCVPEELMKGLGGLEKAMELELTAQSKLARSNPEEVIANLNSRGFHIQMPPPNPII